MQGWHSINPPAGAVGGGVAHKQRWIPVIKSARPTTPTKPPRVPRSRSRINDSNLIYVQTNKWDLPTVINTNIRGALASQLDEIKVTNDDFDADVLAITETWCTSNIPDGSLTLSGFNIYRRDRQDGCQHGGIACYVRNTIPSKHWTEVNQPNLETLWLTIRPPKMPSKDALQRCPPKMPSKDALQRCPPKMPSKDALQRCPPKMPSKDALQRCPPKMPSKDALQRCPPKMPSKDTSGSSENNNLYSVSSTRIR